MATTIAFLTQVRLFAQDDDTDSARDRVHDDSALLFEAHATREAAEAALVAQTEAFVVEYADICGEEYRWEKAEGLAYEADRGGGFWFRVLDSETGEERAEGRALVREISLTVR